MPTGSFTLVKLPVPVFFYYHTHGYVEKQYKAPFEGCKNTTIIDHQNITDKKICYARLQSLIKLWFDFLISSNNTPGMDEIYKI